MLILRLQSSYIFKIYKNKNNVNSIILEKSELETTTSFFHYSLGFTENANWIFAVRIIGNNKSIEETTEFFKDNNVDIRPFFYPINKHGHLTSIENNDEISLLLNKEIIMIPSSPSITIEEQKIVVDIINRFLLFQ